MKAKVAGVPFSQDTSRTTETTSMTTSPIPFLAELAAGASGPPIPRAKRAYFQQRLRNSFFNYLLGKFEAARLKGLTKAVLARRIEKSPEQITRWLGAPSNLTLDVACELLLGIAAEEFEPNSSSPLSKVESNYSHFHILTDGACASPMSAQQPKPSMQAQKALADSPKRNTRKSGASDLAAEYIQ
jgi:hypothetical protein